MAYHAKKRLGQHFLTSAEILSQLTELILSKKPTQLVEVGPGQGALSEPLAQSGIDLLAVEFDPDMLRYLNKRMRSFDNFRIINADFLHFDPAEHKSLSFPFPPLLHSEQSTYKCPLVSFLLNLTFFMIKQ